MHAALETRGFDDAVFVLEGPGYDIRQVRQMADAQRLSDFLRMRTAAALLRRVAEIQVHLDTATRDWDRVVPDESHRFRRAAKLGLARATFHAARVTEMLRSLGPRLLVTFDEAGLWGRVVPAAAERLGVQTLDLAHAGVASAASAKGLGYSKVAVFGERSAAVLRRAGIPDERLAITGAPHLDGLMSSASSWSSSSQDRQILFASQYLIGAMTPAVKRRTLLATIEFAARVAPSEVVVISHPLETDSVVAATLSDISLPDGVRVRQGGELHKELPNAMALLTAWSNSVLEAAACGVPAFVISTTEGVPDPGFVRDGLAVCLDESTLEAAAVGVLNDEWRRNRVTQAREALSAHNHGVDGQAAGRVADLVMTMLKRSG